MPGKKIIDTGKKGYFVHESSYVDEPCEIGEGTKIWHFSHIMGGCRIGRSCNIGQNAVVSPGVVLGDNIRNAMQQARRSRMRRSLPGKLNIGEDLMSCR